MKARTVFLATMVLMGTVSTLASQTPPRFNATVYVTDLLGRSMSDAIVTLISETTKERSRLSATRTEGEYSASAILIGDYTLEVSVTGFLTELRRLSLDQDHLWFAVGLGVGRFETPSKMIDLSGKVTLKTSEQRPLWIRAVSLYGNEMREALLASDGTYRLDGLRGDGPYAIWVLGAERLCFIRTSTFEGKSGKATFNIDISQACTPQK